MVRIKAETLVTVGSQAASEDEEADFGTISDVIDDHEPSFILFRRTLKEGSEGRSWALIS